MIHYLSSLLLLDSVGDLLMIYFPHEQVVESVQTIDNDALFRRTIDFVER